MIKTKYIFLLILIQLNLSTFSEEIVITKVPFTINKPGTYVLGSDIVTPKTATMPAAITIKSSNVNLSLNNFSLSQTGRFTKSQPFQFGVFVTTSLSNISITDGTIRGFNTGIIVLNDVNQLLLQNLVTTNNGGIGTKLPVDGNKRHSGGILLIGTENKNINNVQIVNVSSTSNRINGTVTNTVLNGLLMSDVRNVDIVDSSFNTNIATSRIGVAGIEAFHSKNVFIENSSANGNNNRATAAISSNANCIGFHFNFDSSNSMTSDQHKNITLTSCTANRNTCSNVRCAGFRFFGVENLNVLNSESNESINRSQDAASFDTTITAAGGFIVNICDNFVIQNCVANDHQKNTSRVVGGFDITRSNYGVIKNCFASGNANTGIGTFGGFLIEPIASRPGFDRSTGIVFDQCVAENNVGSALTGGFTIYRADSCKILNCKSIKNQPEGIAIGTVAVGDNVVNSVVESNELISNSTFGIIQTPNAASDSNSYIANIASKNTTNYSIPTGNSIVSWTVSAGGPVPAGVNPQIDNLSIS